LALEAVISLSMVRITDGMSDEFGPKIRVRIFDGMKTARCSC